MADSLAPVFNALSGPELLKTVLADIERKLLATGEFEGHMTFPWVKYQYEVAMVVYPKQAVDAEPGISAKGDFEAGTLPSNEEVPEPAHTFDVKDSVVVDTPNIARIESDQPIPTPGRGPGGVLIDKPVSFVKPDANRKPFGYTGTDGKGKHGTGQSAS